MSNVLSEEKQKQVIALGQFGWTPRRIERETGIRRETVGGISGRPVWSCCHRVDGGGRQPLPPAKPANEVEVTTDPAPSRCPSASACLPFHERIEAALSKGRNAMAIWQDLVDQSGFTGVYESVKRYVRKLPSLMRLSCFG